MTITQTVDIAADRRVHLDFELPAEIPTGKVRVSITPVEEEKPKSNLPLLSLRGSRKGRDTMEAYFARKRVEKEREDLQDLKRWLKVERI